MNRSRKLCAASVFSASLWLTCVTALVASISLLAQESADPGRIIKALDLKPGSRVGEIGAGDGTLTIALARHVGKGGKVFTTELGDGNLRALRSAVEASGLAQVEVVEAHTTSTNLADGCCDAIVMRDVYHHFADPAAMGASLYASVKPGGFIVVLDFAPPPGQESATPDGRSKDGHHGIGRQTVSRELTAAGFTALTDQSLDGRRFMVVGRRP